MRILHLTETDQTPNPWATGFARWSTDVDPQALPIIYVPLIRHQLKLNESGAFPAANSPQDSSHEKLRKQEICKFLCKWLEAARLLILTDLGRSSWHLPFEFLRSVIANLISAISNCLGTSRLASEKCEAFGISILLKNRKRYLLYLCICFLMKNFLSSLIFERKIDTRCQKEAPNLWEGLLDRIQTNFEWHSCARPFR